MTSPVIRPVEDRDYRPIADLTNHYILNTAVHFAEHPISADDLRADYAPTRDTHPFLVAEVPSETPNQPPRFAGFTRAYIWRSRHAYRFTAETSIYIVDDFHRTGIARALYTALLHDLRARNFRTAVAGMTLPNPASAAFHEALGFTHTATFHNVGFKFNQWHSVAFYTLDLTTLPRPLANLSI